jgi:hypothetical protein
MAKIKFGGMVADARGKLDGVVYSKNQYGAYVRNKVSPVQPQTARQTLVRERLTQLSKAYSTVLTDAARAAWSGFAKINPSVDIFGQPQAQTGIATYVRLNSVLFNVGSARIDVPPANLAVKALMSVNVTASAGPNAVSVGFTATPTGAAEMLYLFATQGFSAGRQFFKPAMRFIGSGGPALASPMDATALYVAKFGDLVTGQVIGFMVAVADNATGAVSPGLFARVVVG